MFNVKTDFSSKVNMFLTSPPHLGAWNISTNLNRSFGFCSNSQRWAFEIIVNLSQKKEGDRKLQNRNRLLLEIEVRAAQDPIRRQ